MFELFIVSSSSIVQSVMRMWIIGNHFVNLITLNATEFHVIETTIVVEKRFIDNFLDRNSPSKPPDFS